MEDLPPVITLEDLVGHRAAGAEASATARVLFPRCKASASELAIVESHLRRCLAYPATAHSPAFSGRGELLLAILEELRDGANVADGGGGIHGRAASIEPLGAEAPLPEVAARTALADLEAAISVCRDEISVRLRGSRATAFECTRWRRRKDALDVLARPLRERLGIPFALAAGGGSVRRTPSFGLAATSAQQQQHAGGRPLASRVLRSLSFDRKKKSAEAPGDDKHVVRAFLPLLHTAPLSTAPSHR